MAIYGSKSGKIDFNQPQTQKTITLTDGQRWTVFTIISLVSFFSNFDGGIVSQSTKQIGEDLNATQTMVGLVQQIMWEE